MENEQAPPASSASSTGTTTATTTTSSTTTTSGSAGRQAVPQISVYSGIPDRQTVQVIQQALHRQPSTAAQYLQQMYAAQQQHLMLQTAALQQQQLSSAQLQSLAAVQQASIAAGRQGSSQNGASSQHTGSTQTTINLTTSPAAAHLISRAQSVSSAPAGISQQAVLLGNPPSPALTASQAQMYLRAQMAQQSNLVQVARSLGRAVPLSPQLIFTPTATVTAVQPDASSQSAGQQSASAQRLENTRIQVQNLAIRSQQGPASASPSQTQLQGLSLKQSPLSVQATGQLKSSGQGGQGGQGSGGKGSPPEASTEGGKKSENASGLEARVVNMSRNVTSVSSHPLIAPAYAQIQPHQLVQQHKQQQFVIQQQPQVAQRSPAQMLQTASVQPHLQTQTLATQPPTTGAPAQSCSIPVLPKPQAPSQQATIFHSTVGPQSLAHPAASSGQPKAQPVQLTAINLQIQPTATTGARLVQDKVSKEKPTSLVVRETNPNPITVQSTTTTQQGVSSTDQCKSDSSKSTAQAEGAAEGASATTGPGSPPAMTSGNENDAPSVAGSAPQNGENKPPQAIVKPQVLTHVIEGFVIQEGAEPFPVERAPQLVDSLKKPTQQLPSDTEKTPQSNPPNTTDSEMEELNQQELRDQDDENTPRLRCELCGWVDFAYKFKGSKRFCSMVCAKRYNVGCTKRMGLFNPDRSKSTNRWRRKSRSGSRQSVEAKKQRLSAPQQPLGGSVSSNLPSQPSQGESSPCSEVSSYEGPPSPLSAASSGAPGPQGDRGSDPEGAARELPLLTQHFLPNDPTQWNVEEVYEFIRSLPGCQEIADEFRSQEIDGQALLLLKEDHLMSAMNIKLGPALKIYARISMLKDS
ncbi:polyhomeotic-like protein 2b isoform X2 [Scleropages formosus]|uniref:polyhomeotic-like protein 2b isoform X2 n=1 Tax=Scleropages formosus TaxID=113540 RepID=UPI0010FAA61D|nr:polyhomeotic-like protein 2 isoform X2 [Scleropages formosus]